MDRMHHRNVVRLGVALRHAEPERKISILALQAKVRGDAIAHRRCLWLCYW